MGAQAAAAGMYLRPRILFPACPTQSVTRSSTPRAFRNTPIAVSTCAPFNVNYRAREITERPDAPSGVAAFMSAHSKTPYITPTSSMDFPLGKGYYGAQGAAAGICLAFGYPHF